MLSHHDTDHKVANKIMYPRFSNSDFRKELHLASILLNIFRLFSLIVLLVSDRMRIGYDHGPDRGYSGTSVHTQTSSLSPVNGNSTQTKLCSCLRRITGSLIWFA